MKHIESWIIVALILLTISSCKKHDDLNVQVKGTVIDITKNSPVQDMYINLIYCAGLGAYLVVDSSKTDINGYFELNYTLDREYEFVSVAVNEDPDPYFQTNVLSQYDCCFPCQGLDYIYAGTDINTTINVTRYTSLTVYAVTNDSLTVDEYISAEIPGAGTCCISQFPYTVDKVPALEERTISWTVKRDGVINNYQQTIICQADTMNYFTINY